MQIYLPIAEMSVNILLLLGLGGMVGVMSGMFGVGGGFLLTPLLMLMGIPSTISVATVANQVVGSSVSGVLAQIKRRGVDFRMGFVLLVGGFIGAALGMILFERLRRMGQADLLISLSYVIFLGGIGSLMLVESLKALVQSRKGHVRRKLHRHGLIHRLPFKMRFRASGLYISVIPPLLVGAGTGVLVAVMGVGGGFIMVPAMIYILEMPTKVVIGTSLFQITFVAALTTILHAINSHSVDLVLAIFLLLGGAIGAQIGTRLGARMPAEQLRILLALLVLGVCIRLGLGLVLEPDELYSIEIVRAAG